MSMFLVRRACFTFLSCNYRSKFFFSRRSIQKVFFLQLWHSSCTIFPSCELTLILLSKVMLFFSPCLCGSAAFVVYYLLSYRPKQLLLSLTLLYFTALSSWFLRNYSAFDGVFSLASGMLDGGLVFWKNYLWALYFSMLRTNFLQMYLEYYRVKPSLPRRSREMRLVLFFSIKASYLTPSSFIRLLRRFRHFVQPSPFRNWVIYVTERSVSWLFQRFSSQRPLLERSSAGDQPRMLRKKTIQLRLLACQERILPTMPPTSQRQFDDRSKVIKVLFSARATFICQRCCSVSPQEIRPSSRREVVLTMPSFSYCRALTERGTRYILTDFKEVLVSMARLIWTMKSRNFGVQKNDFI